MAQTGADVQAQFKPFTSADIQSLTDSGSFTKGQTYYRNGFISDQTLRGSRLQSECEGSSDENYLVQATLLPVTDKTTTKLASWQCSCPRGGFCKHIVALLLTWITQPASFEVRLPISQLLAEKSQPELISLIERMLESEPKLELMVDLLSSTSGKSVQPVNTASIKQQAEKIFRTNRREWDADSDTAEELSSLVDIGDSYAEARHFRNAQSVYATIAEVAIEHYEEFEEADEIIEVIGDCVIGLAKCLDSQPGLTAPEKLDPPERLDLMRTLYGLWQEGSNYGQYEYEVDVAELIAGNADPAERGAVESWVRHDIKDSTSDWKRRTLLEFLNAFKVITGENQEEMLDEYRQAGLYVELTDKLLDLGRTEEAVKTARQHLSNYRHVLDFAERLLRLKGQWIPLAFAFVESRIVGTFNQGSKGFSAWEIERALEWLGERYSTIPDYFTEALNVALRRFQISPGYPVYKVVKAAAALPGQTGGIWNKTAPVLIQSLRNLARWGDLVQIYLEEGELTEALAALKKLEQSETGSNRGSDYGFAGKSALDHYREQVAAAIEKLYPEEALRLYQTLADSLVASRQRQGYQYAADYLVQVKNLYSTLQRSNEWPPYIQTFRTQYKSLRALKQELDARQL